MRLVQPSVIQEGFDSLYNQMRGIKLYLKPIITWFGPSHRDGRLDYQLLEEEKFETPINVTKKQRTPINDKNKDFLLTILGSFLDTYKGNKSSSPPFTRLNSVNCILILII